MFSASKGIWRVWNPRLLSKVAKMSVLGLILSSKSNLRSTLGGDSSGHLFGQGKPKKRTEKGGGGQEIKKTKKIIQCFSEITFLFEPET